jgi:hypothetical protein
MMTRDEQLKNLRMIGRLQVTYGPAATGVSIDSGEPVEELLRQAEQTRKLHIIAVRYFNGEFSDDEALAAVDEWRGFSLEDTTEKEESPK